MTRRTQAGEASHNRIMHEIRAERVFKDDGRYLIYYSWPDDEPAVREAGRSQEPQPPAQQPWSPEAGPNDV